MKRRITLCGCMVEYVLTYKAVKNLNMRIKEDGISVSAPYGVPGERVDEFVKRNEDTVMRTLEKYAARPEKESGVYYYLGQRCEVQVQKGKKDGVELADGVACITCAGGWGEAYVKDVLDRFENERMMELLRPILDRMLEVMKPYNIVLKKVTIRSMKSRWGSCTMQDGSIRINRELIHYPVRCMEEVVLHELCHFVHGDHSRAFYALMTQLMPDWKQRKTELEDRSRNRMC